MEENNTNLTVAYLTMDLQFEIILIEFQVFQSRNPYLCARIQHLPPHSTFRNHFFSFYAI